MGTWEAGNTYYSGWIGITCYEGRIHMATNKSIQQAEADRKHAIRVSLKLNKMFDYEIVEWLKKQPNKQAAIKDAILYYIEHEND